MIKATQQMTPDFRLQYAMLSAGIVNAFLRIDAADHSRTKTSAETILPWRRRDAHKISTTHTHFLGFPFFLRSKKQP